MTAKRLIKRSRYPSDVTYVHAVESSYMGLTRDTVHRLPHKLRRSYLRALDREEARITREVSEKFMRAKAPFPHRKNLSDYVKMYYGEYDDRHQ